MLGAAAKACMMAGLTLLFLTGTAKADDPRLPQRLHLLSKPAIVRVVAGYVAKWEWDGRIETIRHLASGSGFMISPDGYIATNAHVVWPLKEEGERVKERLFELYISRILQINDEADTEKNRAAAKKILTKAKVKIVGLERVSNVFLQSGKVYNFEIKSSGAPTGQGTDLAMGKDVAVLKIEAANLPTLRFGDSDKVQVGDHLYALGFPVGAESAGLSDEAVLEPTISEGTVSAIKSTVDNTRVLQINAAISKGSSGGPAIDEAGNVVGIVTFRGNSGDQANEGFSFLLTANTAKEFVRQSGGENRQGPMDDKYRQALEALWHGDYRAAKEKLSDILILNPDHKEARRLVLEAQVGIDKKASEDGKSFGQSGHGGAAGWIGMLVLGVALGAGGTLLGPKALDRLRQRRAPPQEGENPSTQPIDGDGTQP